MKEIFFDLFLPAFDFIQKTSYQFQRADSLHPLCCTVESTIDEVMQKFSANHVHRMFLVNREHMPLQVISLCDVISLLGWPVVE
jgi:predicted transcriptional regulator